MAVVRNCKIYSKDVLVDEVSGIINSDKFSRSYADLYFSVTFLGGQGVDICDGFSKCC